MMKVLAAAFILLFCLAPALAAEPESSTTKLDHASLQVLLQDLGYEPVEMKFSQNNEPYWQISISRGPWRYDLGFSIYDAGFLYTSVEFGLYQGAKEGIPQSVLLSMLAANFNLSWSRFAYLPESGKFALLSNLRNKNINVGDLRRVIDEMVDAADRNQNLWVPDQWPKPAPEQTAPAQGTAAGTAQ